jgi:carbonic anhydrase
MKFSRAYTLCLPLLALPLMGAEHPKVTVQVQATSDMVGLKTAEAASGTVNVRTALDKLRRGNEIYAAGNFDPARASASRRVELVKGQHPFAVVLTCADSRVPPELIFDQGLGDLFVIRTAGAVADSAVLGSIEYATEHLHVPLVVVMGHSSCGAVKAALEPAGHGPDIASNLTKLVAAIRPALAHMKSGGDVWENAVYASIGQNLSDIFRLSPMLTHMRHSNEAAFVGAFYHLDSGKVDFIESSLPVTPMAAHLHAGESH